MWNVPVSRRRVLRDGALAALALGAGPRVLLRTARGQTASKRVLVAIFQRGAVDGLSMVVPYSESRYYALRPSIAIPAPGGGSDRALDLDGAFGFHPALASLYPFYQAGEVAVVHACGSPAGTRSHFDAQDYMETAMFGVGSGSDGWLNRHLQSSSATSASVFRAVATSSQLPRSLSGAAPTLAVSDLSQLRLGRGATASIVQSAIAEMYGTRTDLLGTTVNNAVEAVDLADTITSVQPENGAQYPTGELGGQLRQVAQLIKADVGLEVAFANVGGWDTHSNQGGSTGQLATLLRGLSDSLAAFRTDLGSRFADVCVLTMSEFGRTVAENGSGGSDHGHATAMLVFGGTAAGGRVYGQWPGLDEADLLDGRDLAVTTDFRTLFAELVDRHLGNPNVGVVFPGFTYDATTRLGVIT